MATKKRKYKPLTDQEKQMVVDAADPKQLRDLAFVLGRDPETLRRMRWTILNRDKDREYKKTYRKKLRDIQSPTYNKPWTLAEMRLILESKEPDTVLATKLGRSMDAIAAKRYRLQTGQEKLHAKQRGRKPKK